MRDEQHVPQRQDGLRQREPYGDLAGRLVGASDRVSNCIEAAGGHPGLIPVRDGKVPAGPVLLVAAPAWAALVEFAAER